MSRRPTRDARGQSLVEFALVIPLILLLFMGIFDFGRAIYAYNTISNAARDGARKAIVDQTAGVASQEAADQATALGINPATQVVISYLQPDKSGACPARSVGCLAQVTVSYTFTAITPIISNVVGPIPLSSTTLLPIERTYP